MTKIESDTLDFLKKHFLLIFAVLITLIGAVLRISGIDFESGDYKDFLSGWWNQIEPYGLLSMKTQIGNYNIPYQFLIAVFTYLPLGALYSYKTMSIVFDLVLAVSCAMLVYELTGRTSKLKAIITYAVMMCSVNIIFNSAFWAQCDSMYVSFVILAIYFLIRHKNIASFVMLGIAFAFKLQTVFIIPFFLLYYFVTKKCSIFHFFIIPAVDFILCLPAIIMGRPITDVVMIYAEQTDYGKQIQMNCPNFNAMMCSGFDTKNYYLLKTFALCLTIAILLAVFAVIIVKKVDLSNLKIFMMTAIWSVWTCIMFLPSMHERYGYLLDILTIIFAVFTFKKVWAAVLCNLVSFRGYCYYLFNYETLSMQFTAIIYMVGYLVFTFMFIKEALHTDSKKDVEKITVKQNS